MWAKITSFCKGTGTTFIVLAMIQLALSVGITAYKDYGWLGVVVVLTIGVPFAPLFFLAGWFFLPIVDMWWIYALLSIGVLFSWIGNRMGRK